MTALILAVAVYSGGVVLGLLFTDGPPAHRIGYALAWPLGPAAFVVTVTLLLAAATIAFPLFGIAVAVVLTLLAWTWSDS